VSDVIRGDRRAGISITPAGPRTAGVGTDAAPYFRIFNPVLQAKKADPRGDFVRRWVPELAKVPETFIHEPRTMSAAAQLVAGCVIGKDYPSPLVDHAQARARALRAYGQRMVISPAT
jgi:deoxyribodipyrimidine photo-lyase